MWIRDPGCGMEQNQIRDPQHCWSALLQKIDNLRPTYGWVGGGVEGGEDDGLLVEGERLLIPAPPI